MKHIFASPLALLLLVSPLHAQEPPSLMERGARQFFEGLKNEMAPALKEMAALLEEAGPALRNFMTEMGPKLGNVLEEVEDWSVYAAPEILPNGDIIMRHKPDAPENEPDIIPDTPMPQIDL